MPYDSNAGLPDTVKVLPSGAQTQWRKAFNSALKQYGDEETAMKVAWAAVKRSYKKEDGKWVKASDSIDISLDGEITAYSSVLPDDVISLFAGRTVMGEIMYFKGVLARAEVNKNRDEIPLEGIQEICDSLPFMPVDVEHVDNQVIGYFIKANPVDDDTAVGVEGIIYNRRFPDIAQKMTEGKLGLSIEARAKEATCGECGQTFTKTTEYCDHLKAKHPLRAIRKFKGLTAFGGAVTETPAGTDTFIDDDSLQLVATSEGVSILAMSIEKMRDSLHKRMREMMAARGESGWGYIAETNPDSVSPTGHVIYQVEGYDGNTKTYKCPYTMDDSDNCQMGDWEAVESVWQPVEGMEHPDLIANDLRVKITGLEKEKGEIEAKLEAKVTEEVHVPDILKATQAEVEILRGEISDLKARAETMESERDLALKAKEDAIAESNRIQTELKASERVSQLSEIIGSNKALEKKSAISAMDDESFNVLLATTKEAAENARPKAGSLKGIFGGTEQSEEHTPLTSFAGVFK